MLTVPVCVVIPCHNRAALLPRAIASVRAQVAVQPAEVIVVDDASTDASVQVAEGCGVTVLRKAMNEGPAAARNLAFSHTRQAYVAQLDSDDEWLPHCLAKLWHMRATHVLVAGASLARTGDGRVHYNGVGGSRPVVLKSGLPIVFPDNYIASSAVMVRLDALRAAGGYRTKLRYAEDLDLWIRLLAQGTGVVTPEPLTSYHHHQGQATSNRAEVYAGHREVLREAQEQVWCSDRVLRQWEVVPRWQDLRQALRDRNGVSVGRSAMWFLASTTRMGGLGALLRHRLRTKRARRRYARWAEPGVPGL